MLSKRLEQLRQKMARQGLSALLISNLKNIYYLTGFWGSAGSLLVTADRLILMTDSRYSIHARNSVGENTEIIETRDALGVTARIIKDMGLKTIGFEDQISFAYYQSLVVAFAGAEIAAQRNFIEELRMIKDEKEIATIQQACKISDQAFLDALDFIKIGMTDLEVANFLDFRMRELGAVGVSFDTIAVSGARSAMPHGTPSPKKIEAGDALTLDFGCLYEHYVSDMTRTIYLDHVSDEEQVIYETVLRANKALIKEARAGLSIKDFDKIPRDIIVAAGYGDYFTHGIGHGMGLDVHEEPYFNQDFAGEIKAGMVLTDEPGIYIDGKYGVRIEDDLLITETGCEILTLAPKELIVI